jgi:BMFP domain-containing protein YqiC
MKPVNFAFKQSIPRRSFLRGVGVALALPMLDAMLPAFGASTPPVKRRTVAICTTLGIYPENLFPKETGRGYKASPYSQVLEEFRDQFTIFSGLSHPEVDGGHASEASFLTAAPHPGASGFRNTISLDQLGIEKLSPDTRFSSLMLASTTNYSLSWTRNGVNIPAEERPSKVFARLFLDGSAAEVDQQVRRLKDGQSIMDIVGNQAKGLQRAVGTQDREKLDQYFTSVRELEQRLVQAEDWARKPKPKVDMKPPTDPQNRADIIATTRPLFDLIHLAFQTDSTRMVTFRLQGLNQVPPIEGVTQDWHNLSHHGKDPTKLDELAIIEKTELHEVRNLLANLKASTEGGANLLDRTMVLYGSNLGNSSSHDTRNMPIVLAGGGFKHGQHLAFEPQSPPPLCNLYLQMLRQLGVDTNAFGSSKATSIPGFETA